MGQVTLFPFRAANRAILPVLFPWRTPGSGLGKPPCQALECRRSPIRNLLRIGCRGLVQPRQEQAPHGAGVHSVAGEIGAAIEPVARLPAYG